MQRHLSVYRTALISLAIKLGGSGLLLVLSVYISRTFGAGGFGVFSLYISMLLPLSMLSRLGLENNLLRLVAKVEIAPSTARRLFQQTALVTLMAASGLALLVYIINLVISPADSARKFISVLPWLAIGLPFHALLFSLIHYFRGRHHVFTSMIFENIVLYLVLLLWLTGAGLHGDTPSIPGAVTFSCIITLLLALLFYLSGKTADGERATENFVSLKERLRESLPMLTTSLSTIAFVTLDVFILSLFLDASEVGIYAAAAKLVAFVSFPLMAVIGMIAPRLSALDDDSDGTALQSLFRQSTGFVFWSSLPIALAITLIPEYLLGLFGEGFESATDVIYILLAGHVTTLMLGPIGYLLWMTGHALALQKITLLSLGVSVGLCLLLIPLFGIIGAAIAITTGLLIKNLGSWVLVRKHLHFNPLYLPWESLIHASRRKP